MLLVLSSSSVMMESALLTGNIKTTPTKGPTSDVCGLATRATTEICEHRQNTFVMSDIEIYFVVI